jgi:hypothetical protein
MMNKPSNTLENMSQSLALCQQGHASTTQMVRHWRVDAAHLPLPDRYGEVLNQLLDRMESSALFTEESCSFSQQDQLASLTMWLDKARQHIAQQDSAKPAEGQP